MPGTFAIGIETEVLISPRTISQARKSEDFSREVVRGYLKQLQQTRDLHPGMHNAINESSRGARFSEWSLDEDSTIELPARSSGVRCKILVSICPREADFPAQEGLELISPILRVQAGSAWRSHVAFIWFYLEKAYDIAANNSCGTHIHVSVAGGYTLVDLQRIACSIIYFEPALEAVLPPDRQGNMYAKSNRIDNKNFGYKNLSRRQAMDEIAACPNLRALVLLMNPPREGDHDKMFGWNFLNLLQSSQSTIEFRRGAASTSSTDVFMWAEVALSFVRAAMRKGTRDNLSRIPPTVGGLLWFINAGQIPADEVDQRYIDRLFAGIDQYKSLSPTACGRLSPEKASKLKKKKLEDKKKNLMLLKTLQGPYWT